MQLAGTFPPAGRRAFAALLAAAALLFAVSLGGCATALDARLAQVRTIADAQQYFGDPSSLAPQPDGTTHYQWVEQRTDYVPGQWVEREQYMGHDRDGYPVFRRWREFVPEHMVQRNCRMTIVATGAGVVTDSSWEGRGCNAIFGQP